MVNELLYLVITVFLYLSSSLIINKLGRKIGIESSSDNGYSTSLESLRGVAAFLVFGAHSSMYFGMANKQVMASTMGEVGVLLFFMLTGHLFWNQIRNGKYHPGVFFRKRVMRLVPIYVVVITTFTLLDWVGAGFPVPNLFQLLSIIKNYGFGFSSVMNSTGNVNDVFSKDMFLRINSIWTLKWEWLFYITIPLLAFFERFRYVTIFSVAISCFFYNPLNILSGETDIVFIMAFWFGALTVEIEKRRTGSFKFIYGKTQSIAVLFAGVAMLFYYLFGGDIEQKNIRVPYMLLCVFPVFLFFVISKEIPGRVLWKPMEMVGKVSYSFYLWHLGINYYVMHTVIIYFHNTQNWPSMIIICFLMMLIASVVSCFTYKLIEDRFLHKKNK